ncbi:MAG: D-glycerate dehydrogenase, partial [Anaerolineae bacterium]|nr:D-glycerate dehydrogenase [Anaerolineae bacterium]
MNKAKVFITRNLPEIGIQLLAEYADLDIWPGDLPPDQPSLLEHCAGVDGILCLLTDRMDAAVMDAAGPKLKVISQYAVGYDNIDIAAATQRGIPVGNTPGVLTDATADMTWALLMAAARRIVESDRFVREGSWKTWGPTLLLGPEVAHSTLGIVGFGRIGQAVARRARGFDMRVLYYSRNRQQDMEQTLGVEFAPLEQLLREADFISLHTPLTPQTKNLISSRELSLMK